MAIDTAAPPIYWATNTINEISDWLNQDVYVVIKTVGSHRGVEFTSYTSFHKSCDEALKTVKQLDQFANDHWIVHLDASAYPGLLELLQIFLRSVDIKPCSCGFQFRDEYFIRFVALPTYNAFKFGWSSLCANWMPKPITKTKEISYLAGPILHTIGEWVRNDIFVHVHSKNPSSRGSYWTLFHQCEGLSAGERMRDSEVQSLINTHRIVSLDVTTNPNLILDIGKYLHENSIGPKGCMCNLADRATRVEDFPFLQRFTLGEPSIARPANPAKLVPLLPPNVPSTRMIGQWIKADTCVAIREGTSGDFTRVYHKQCYSEMSEEQSKEFVNSHWFVYIDGDETSRLLPQQPDWTSCICSIKSCVNQAWEMPFQKHYRHQDNELKALELE